MANIPWGPIITAAGQVAGSYIGYQGQKMANAANAAAAQKAMDFEERMSNTAMQRGRQDLEAAGFNPALAYNKGGADTPTGKMSEAKNAFASFGGTAQAAAETFNSIQRTTADVQRTNAETQLTKAQANQLNLESAARAEQIKNTAALTGTNARFASSTFDDRAQSIWLGNRGQAIDNSRGNLELQYHTDMYQRNKDVLWPLAVEQLRQDIARSSATTRDVTARATLNELAIPTAQNISRMAQTQWGKNISPFLSDAATIARMLSIGGGMIR